MRHENLKLTSPGVCYHDRSMSEPSQSGVTSATLLSRARASDAAAWKRLVELYSPLVYHWCRQSGFTSHDAADLMQDVFQSVYRALDSFDRGKTGAFRAWLWTITRNKIRNVVRKAAPVAEGGSTAQERWQNLPDNEPAPSEHSVTGERPQSLLQRALDLVRGDFNESTWKAFERTVIEQRPAAEVGAELGLSSGAVYKARDRVLRRLHEELGDVLAFS
jgi:RNA polymerase sigma-70 factor, ECF subfamily